MDRRHFMLTGSSAVGALGTFAPPAAAQARPKDVLVVAKKQP